VRNGTVPASDGSATATLAASTARLRPAAISGRSMSRWLVRAVQVGLATLILAWFVSQSFYDHAADFKTFFSAGYAVRHPEIPLYDLVALDENPFGEVFKLAPSAAVYLVPFSYGTVQQARLIWRCVLVATMLVAYGALMHTLGFGTLGWVWLVGLAAWSAFGPLQIGVGEGQWDPVLLLVVSLATVAVSRRRDALGAIAIAFGASIKPYPLILAGYFVARRRWVAASVTAVAFGALTLLGALVVGLDEAAAFVTRVLPASGTTTAYADNQSLGGIVARAWTTDLKPLPLANARPVDLMIRIGAVVLCALTIWLVARRPGDDPMRRTLQLALFVPLSILVIPAAWTHYQAILLVPLTLLAVEQARSRPRDIVGWVALAVAYAVLMLPNPTMLYGPEIDRGLWLRSRADAANLALERLYPTTASRLILSFKAFAVIFLFALTAWRVVRPSSPRASRDAPAGLPISARVPT
jgi:hypothetical protein